MDNRIYLKNLPCYKAATEAQIKAIGKNPYYDLQRISSATLREELSAFVLYRSTQVGIARIYRDRQQFNKVCRFLERQSGRIESLKAQEPELLIRKFKSWMLVEGIPLTDRGQHIYGGEYVEKAREISYLERMLKFFEKPDTRPEQEKDVWELDELDITVRLNPIKQFKTISFEAIVQKEMREEVKKGIYLNLQKEAITCVQKEMTALRRFSGFLHERYPSVQSFKEIDRELMEEYLIYLKTEQDGINVLHAEMTRFRTVLESIARACDYLNLAGVFLARDIPPHVRKELKSYSDGELRRLNAALVKMDEQVARLMIIHQMLGTRISDTLTLEPDCLQEKSGVTIIRIRQMKAGTYEKPISEELASLIRRAIAYTRERYGETPYIFTNGKNPDKPMQYGAISSSVVRMLRKENLCDDNGEPFGFGTHLYRHCYGIKLADMHLDDWTIARLLGHKSLHNVKYYRKMSNQLLAEETRFIRQQMSELILANLDGWEEEYVKIREDDSLE